MRNSFSALLVIAITFVHLAVADKAVDAETSTKRGRSQVNRQGKSRASRRGGARDLSKLSSLVGLSKGPPKLTKANVDKLQTIARRGPDKPSSVGEIMGYTFVGSMLAFLAYLQFGLGLGSAKMGSPTAN